MIRVFLVENEHLVREGLRALLALEPEVTVVGEAAGGAEAIEQVPRAAVDVLLLDLRMPEVSGLQVLEELSRQRSLPPTLILTTFDQTWDLVECVRRGARGIALFSTLTIAAQAQADWPVEDLWYKCKGCHGMDGKANTAIGVKQKIPDFTSPEWQAQRTDEDIRKVIAEGSKKKGSKMKPWKSFSRRRRSTP